MSKKADVCLVGETIGTDHGQHIKLDTAELYVDPRAHRVQIGILLPADSPRLEGEDDEHIRMLAESDAKLPPVLVHRSSLRVIDGMHRLAAARLRGDDEIEVRFFEGSEPEAFVLAVHSNTRHGRPLSLADRVNAAERIIRSHPAWSDQVIAEAAGLGVRKVSSLRHRVSTETGGASASRTRTGRDGRVRPVDNAEGRERAAAHLRDSPDASVREIARSAGVSPATALDVRNRVQCGKDPVPASTPRAEAAPPEAATAERASRDGLTTILEGLRRDPSLRFNESGRLLLRWVCSRAIRPGEWQELLDGTPSHCRYIIANLARTCADEWARVADELDRQTRVLA